MYVVTVDADICVHVCVRSCVYFYVYVYICLRVKYTSDFASATLKAFTIVLIVNHLQDVKNVSIPLLWNIHFLFINYSKHIRLQTLKDATCNLIMWRLLIFFGITYWLQASYKLLQVLRTVGLLLILLITVFGCKFREVSRQLFLILNFLNFVYLWETNVSV